MICKAKDNYGFMPSGNAREYGISPVDGRENEKVWPKGEAGFKIVKGESYNVEKNHPFFESKILSGEKVSNDHSPAPDSGSGSGD